MDLSRRGTQSLFFLVVVLLGGALACLAGKAWLAEHWNASPSPDRWQWAAILEPGNAQYWRHLGLYRLRDLNHGNIHQAIGYFRRATQTDASSAGQWMDLAGAYDAAGEAARAEQAYKRAQADYPISAEISWRYGGFLLHRGLLSRGDAQIRRALLVEPSLAPSAIAECWQVDPNVAAILDKVLPARSTDYLLARDFFLSQHLLDPALAVWTRQIALRLPVKMPDAIPLVNALIDRDRLANAKLAWVQALGAANWPRDRNEDGSLVFNGGFEHPIANGGFDWRENPGSGGRFAFDSRIFHSGSRSLRIEFDGTANLNFQGLFQYVPVRPASRYRFSAYVRTEELSTDSGIRFEILDPRHPAETHILTPNRTGTTPWTQVETDVTTGPDTKLLEIALRRMPSAKFDNKLSGTVWVDDVALPPAQSMLKGASK